MVNVSELSISGRDGRAARSASIGAPRGYGVDVEVQYRGGSSPFASGSFERTV